LLFALFVLLVEIPCRVPIEVLPTSFFGARNLGSAPGFANFKDEVELVHGASNNHHGTDASGLEQRRSPLVGTASVDSGLGLVLASVVSGRNGTASGWEAATACGAGSGNKKQECRRRGQDIRARLMDSVRSWPRTEKHAE
jgi:hypothetical protein